MTAVLHAVLGHWSGQEDFCTGMPVAGSERHRPELENLVGPFNRMVALRCDLSGDPTFTQLLDDTRASVLDALDHQDVPFARVIAALNVPNDPSRAQLCQVLFIVDEFREGAGLTLPGIQIEPFPLAVPKMPYDLMIYARPRDNELEMRFFYDTGLFTETTVSALAARFDSVLRVAVDKPDARLSELLLDP